MEKMVADMFAELSPCDVSISYDLSNKQEAARIAQRDADFDSMDKNKDGCISREEYRAAKITITETTTTTTTKTTTLGGRRSGGTSFLDAMRRAGIKNETVVLTMKVFAKPGTNVTLLTEHLEYYAASTMFRADFHGVADQVAPKFHEQMQCPQAATTQAVLATGQQSVWDKYEVLILVSLSLCCCYLLLCLLGIKYSRDHDDAITASVAAANRQSPSAIAAAEDSKQDLEGAETIALFPQPAKFWLKSTRMYT